MGGELPVKVRADVARGTYSVRLGEGAASLDRRVKEQIIQHAVTTLGLMLGVVTAAPLRDRQRPWSSLLTGAGRAARALVTQLGSLRSRAQGARAALTSLTGGIRMARRHRSGKEGRVQGKVVPLRLGQGRPAGVAETPPAPPLVHASSAPSGVTATVGTPVALTMAIPRFEDQPEAVQFSLVLGCPLLPEGVTLEDLEHALFAHGERGFEEAMRLTGWTLHQVWRAAAFFVLERQRREKVLRRSVERIDTHEDVLMVVSEYLRGYARERVVAVYLDEERRVLQREVVSVGDANTAPFPAFQIAQRSVALGARHVIVAHNHPDGSFEPSAADRKATAALQATLASAGITLLDHVIVTERDFVSFRARGLLGDDAVLDPSPDPGPEPAH